MVHARSGVLRRRDLLDRPGIDLAATKRALTALVADGRLIRESRGIYSLPGADRHLVAACVAGGVLTCVSAAAALDLPLRVAPRAPHVALPQDRGTLRSPQMRDVVIHRDRHVERGTDPRCLPVPLALAHATGCLPVPDAVALMDAAMHRGLVHPGELRKFRPRVGVVRFEHAVRLADPSAQSLPESLARVALRSAGLDVRTQVSLPAVGRVDFLVEGLVIVEIDGRAYHSDPVQFAEDRRRDRQALLLGYPTLRFTANEILRSTRELTATVRNAVHRARSAAA